MGIFNEFNKKEKPVFTGSRFGFGGRGSASAAVAGEPDVIASGGFVSDFTEGSDHYRAHIFVDRGATDFVVHSTPGDAITMDYLVIAGGGGGSRYGAGGAGGLRSTVDQTGGGGSLESAVPISVGTYTITVGTGGRGTWGEGPNGALALPTPKPKPPIPRAIPVKTGFSFLKNSLKILISINSYQTPTALGLNCPFFVTKLS